VVERRREVVIPTLSEMAASIDEFCVDGCLVTRGAVAPHVVGACVEGTEVSAVERAILRGIRQ